MTTMMTTKGFIGVLQFYIFSSYWFYVTLRFLYMLSAILWQSCSAILSWAGFGRIGLHLQWTLWAWEPSTCHRRNRPKRRSWGQIAFCIVDSTDETCIYWWHSMHVYWMHKNLSLLLSQFFFYGYSMMPCFSSLMIVNGHHILDAYMYLLKWIFWSIEYVTRMLLDFK